MGGREIIDKPPFSYYNNSENSGHPDKEFAMRHFFTSESVTEGHPDKV